MLVAFTDGVTDALNSAGEEFGEARLKDVLRAAVGAPAGEVSEKLAGLLRDWIGNAEQHDDLTLSFRRLVEERMTRSMTRNVELRSLLASYVCRTNFAGAGPGSDVLGGVTTLV